MRVLVDADTEVRALADDVTVLVESQSAQGAGWETEAMRRYSPRLEHPWPQEITLNNVDVDSTFQVSATALDQRGAVVGQVRSVRPFSDGLRLTMRLMFEASCLRRTQLCASGETCHGGECVDARKELKDVPAVDPAARDGGPSELMPKTPAVVADGDGCDAEGAQACAGEQSRNPLRCEGGMWRAQPQCAEGQLCDTTVSARRGSCRAIASECLGRELNAEFCDKETMRVCSNMFESMVRPCVENARCISPAQSAMCACRTGFVQEMGVCRKATDCSLENGGCDPLTTCSAASGKPTCGPCPSGYFGDGATGCAAPLTGLATSAGALTPAFDASLTDYTLALPLLVQRVTLTPRSSGSVNVSLNGQALSEAGSWTTPTLPLGEYPIELAVTAPNGAPRTYKIRVKRAGEQVAYVKASSPDVSDNFGMTLAMQGDTLAVGAFLEDSAAVGVNGNSSDDSAVSAGAVYVFTRKAGRWEQEAYLKPSNTVPNLFFGTCVAIAGDTLVVGAIHYDILPFATASPGPGAAYVFERKQGTWQQTAILKPKTSAVGDQFGYGVAIFEQTIAVGAPREAGGGAAYFFERSADGWSETARIVPQKRPADAWFGSVIALSGDTLVVGAQNDSTEVRLSGSAYVFERGGGVWNERQRLAPNPPSDGGSFGYSMALEGGNLLIGAPRYASITSLDRVTPGEVFAYQRVGGSWQQTGVIKAMLPRTSDSFGSGVALRGTSLLVGAQGERSGARGVGADASRNDGAYVGAGYLFALEGQLWRQSAYLKAGNADTWDSFGFSVALSEQSAVLGAVWESSSAKGVNGDDSNNSLDRSGAVYIFE